MRYWLLGAVAEVSLALNVGEGQRSWPRVGLPTISYHEKKLGGKSRLSKSPVCPSQLVGVEKVWGVGWNGIQTQKGVKH